MKRIYMLLLLVLFWGTETLRAQTSCVDLNGYVDYKNVGGTGAYTLTAGTVEKAAQTYYYSGPGKITSVRLYGSYTVPLSGGVPLRVSIYDVDANGRPTGSAISSTNTIWWWYNNTPGYIDVPFGDGGVNIYHKFAVEVELRNAAPYGNSFNLRYTGNGEGHGADLASLAGTQTGGNWTSAKNDFSKDGDFYIVPKMTNFITSDFVPSATCISAGGSVNFSNASQLTLDSMFNKINLPGYTGGQHLYEWNFGDGSAVSYLPSPAHTFAAPGVYSVTLKSTVVGWNNTCSDTKTMQISVGLAVTTNTLVNVSCAGLSNGSINAVGSGGATPYSYSLNSDGEYSLTHAFTGLSANTYTVYIKDNLGCTSQTTFNISQPAAITFAPSTSTNATCGHSDGGIAVTATGGTGTLQYQLNTGAFQSTGAFGNLAAGTYTVNVKDANSCNSSTVVAVNDAGGPVLTVTSMTNVSCNSHNDGTIVLNATGGSGVLQYSINGGTTFQPSGSFLSLAAGTYPVIVKDAAGCSRSTVITLTQPQEAVFSTSSTPATCNGLANGKVQVTSVSGGTGNFTYSINGNYYQSSNTFVGLGANTYTIYIKDAAGCISSTTQTVTEPAVVSAAAATTAAHCNGSYDGSIVITAIGGSGTYQYSIFGNEFQGTNSFPELPAGIYSIQVKDANNCLYTTTATVSQPTPVAASINTTSATCGSTNGGILATASGGSGNGYTYSIDELQYNSTGSFSGLASGSYYVIVKDGAGCENIFPASIADANGPVITGSTHTTVACNGGSDGSITISGVTGGSGVLQYSINGSIWQTSPIFNGLPANEYVVTVKDANGCTGTINQTITEPNAFVINTVLSHNVCYGEAAGSATILSSGGSGVSAYSISNGIVFQSSNVFTNLYAGSHTVIVRDAAGCTGRVTFTINQPTHIDVSTGILNVTCNGDANGVISVITSGGSGGNMFSISGSAYQSSNVFSNLSGGLYTVTVKDANQCTNSMSVRVNEPDALNISANLHDVSCAGGNNGSIVLNLTGGTAPYIYVWSNNNYTPTLFDLPAGIYGVQGWDDNGCSFAHTYTISQPNAPLVVNGVITDATAAGSTDGNVALTVTGGVAPYNYSWSNGSTSVNLIEVGGGTYTVNITDANGCVTSGSYVVGSPVGIENVDAVNNTVTIYPNPTTDVATVEVQGSIISGIKIINAYGAIVLQTEPKQPTAKIYTSSLAAGIYFVQVQVDGHMVTKRLMVSK